MLIYHIVLPETWKTFENKEFYEAESLQSEGFIHCSYESQIDAVLHRYYSGAKQVNILGIDTQKLSSKLVEEASTNNEIYPHIYGPINLEAVASVQLRDLSAASA